MLDFSSLNLLLMATHLKMNKMHPKNHLLDRLLPYLLYPLLVLNKVSFLSLFLMQNQIMYFLLPLLLTILVLMNFYTTLLPLDLYFSHLQEQEPYQHIYLLYHLQVLLLHLIFFLLAFLYPLTQTFFS